MAECFCDINAYALKGMCECEEDCTGDCDICGCNNIDLWYADITASCACGGNCSCVQNSDEVK